MIVGHRGLVLLCFIAVFCLFWAGEVRTVLAIRGGGRYGFQWHWVCGVSGIRGCWTELHNKSTRTSK